MSVVKVKLNVYNSIRCDVEELPWVWKQYEEKQPNEWYQFKYQMQMRHFLEEEQGEPLFSQVKTSFLGKSVKLPAHVYRELKELAEINRELKSILEYPPYGKMGFLHQGVV